MAENFGSIYTSMEYSKKWERTFLCNKCKELDLEEAYDAYILHLTLNYTALYLCVQFVLTTTHCILILSLSSQSSSRYLNVASYCISFVLIVLVSLIYFKENMIKKKRWILYIVSILNVAAIIFIDLGLSLYYYFTLHIILGSFYGVYTIYVIYIFLPIPHLLPPFILGMFVNVAYGVYTLITMQDDNDKFNVVCTDFIHMTGINLLGIFFRLMRDITVRCSFLDRRKFVEASILLSSAKSRKSLLLHNILPPNIAAKLQLDIETRIINYANEKSHLAPNRLLIKTAIFQPHTNVTILYADVVNYTYLTTTLKVEQLVQILHDLYGRFDRASEEYNVQRIKFLGDCYYCVAGLREPDPNHAKCSTDLGLRMIDDIREVRNMWDIDVDMRIGIHSGDLIAGVVGSAKFQYDIWSKDVDIANRLESSGAAGRVHVTEQTLELLDNEYEYENGTEDAKSDPMLNELSIQTYLIKRLKPAYVKSHFWFKFEDKIPRTTSLSNMLQTEEQNAQTNLFAKTQEEIKNELEHMPVGQTDFTKMFPCMKKSSKRSKEDMTSLLTCCCLFFRDSRVEFEYIKQPDPMLKYSIAMSFILYILLCVLLTLAKSSEGPSSAKITITVSVLYTILLILSFYKKIWIMFFTSGDGSNLPKNRLSLFLYKMSDYLQCHIIIRIVIYILILMAHMSTIIIEMSGCNRKAYELNQIEYHLYNYFNTEVCFYPWVVTSAMTLVVGLVFLFSRIPFAFKTLIGFVISVCYTYIVLFDFLYVYEDSPSTNAYMSAEYSHVIFIFLTQCVFNVMERQSEFITKINFKWKLQLLEKKRESRMTNVIITVLLHNVLPAHIGKSEGQVNIRYLSDQADLYVTNPANQLIYEEHEKVAVMFASIKHFDMNKVGLRLLNEIVCEFDEILDSYTEVYKVEKIKVVNWTYMAACGLDMPQHSQEPSTASAASFQKIEARTLGSQFRESKSFNLNPENRDDDQVVLIMAHFAVDLMRTLWVFNKVNEEMGYGEAFEFGEMRIGISSGKIMAGVVGVSKPHYDIWGTPVNMASRMDSTGIVGKIQVTEETAGILKKFDVLCPYRGMTYVKGRGEIPTYFISIDEHFRFLPNASSIDS